MRDKALKKKLQQLHIPQYDEYKLEISFCLLALYHMHFLFAIYSIYFFESSQTFGYCSLPMSLT